MTNPAHNPNQIDSTTALRSRKQPQPGDVLDGIYRLDQPLGKGGVGVVYRAFHLHLQRPCAIKFMHPQLVANAELRTRFRREAQSAFQLGHPHIVAITDFRDDPNAWPYLVMELVTGETMRDRLERGPLEPRLAVRMMIELCDALSAAHRRGVIHRDLKPENLFLTKVPSPGPGEMDTTLKVLDFGLSKLLDGVEITGSGRLLGSPSYMSPEQARGDSHLVDARSDIFSVGALLYECLIGEKMFAAETLDQKRQLIMAAKLPPLQFASRGIPHVDKIITRACALKSEQRFQTAGALQEALEEAERALVGKAVAPIAMPVGMAHVSSTVSAAVPEGSSTAAMGGGEIISAGGLPKRRRAGLWIVAATASLAAVGLGGFAGYSAWRTFAAPPTVTLVPPERTTPKPNLEGDKPVVTTLKPATPQPPVVAVKPPETPTITPPPVAPPPEVTHAALPTTNPTVTPTAAIDQPPKTTPQRAAAVAMQLRPADEPAAVAPTGSLPPHVAPAPFVKGKRGRGPARPIAVGPGPGPSAPVKTGGSLLEIVRLANETLRRAAPSVKRCYPENVNPPDKISVDITIQADGKVSEANIDGAEDAAGCVLKVLRSLHFSPPTDSDSYATRYDFVNLRRY